MTVSEEQMTEFVRDHPLNGEYNSPALLFAYDLIFEVRRLRSAAVESLTGAERETLDAIGKATVLYNQLPKQHPADDREWENSVHRLQDMVAARPTYRAEGSTYTPEQIAQIRDGGYLA